MVASQPKSLPARAACLLKRYNGKIDACALRAHTCSMSSGFESGGKALVADFRATPKVIDQHPLNLATKNCPV